MLFKLSVLAVLLALQLLLVSAQSPEDESKRPLCRKYEQLVKCGNRCAEPRCGQAISTRCPTVCTYGCFCIAGYARDSKGFCVPFKTITKCTNPKIPRTCTRYAICA